MNVGFRQFCERYYKKPSFSGNRSLEVFRNIGVQEPSGPLVTQRMGSLNLLEYVGGTQMVFRFVRKKKETFSAHTIVLSTHNRSQHTQSFSGSLVCWFPLGICFINEIYGFKF